MYCTTTLARLHKTAIILFTCFISLFLSVNVEAASSTPSTYIQTKCKSDCVDPLLLAITARQIGEELNINPLTLIAIAGVESGYRPQATNKTGKSVGLMQIHLFWHRSKFKTKNYFDVFENLRVGAMVYKECMVRWKGSREKALWCYNGHTDIGMQVYVPKVLAEIQRLSKFQVFNL